ncbi:MAG: thrombospondin type 3 repeat-containing protein, partial [Myxococcota bacterium]
MSALAGLAAAAASVAAGAPTYKYVELHQFGGSTLPEISLSLNDRAEIAWLETDAFGTKRLYVKDPRGGLSNPAVTGLALDGISLGKLSDDRTVTYTIQYPLADPRYQSVMTWKVGSPTLEIAGVPKVPGQSFELTPDRNEAGQLAFWHLGAAFDVRRWTAGTLESNLDSAAWMTETLIAPDGELFFEKRAGPGASSSEIYRGQNPPFTPFVSAADFAGVARVNTPVDLNAAKTLLFTRMGAVYLKAQAGTPIGVSTLGSCADPEISDAGEVLCIAPVNINLRSTASLGSPYTVVAPGAAVAGSTVTALGTVASLNDLGQVAFTAQLANGVVGIYLATPDTCDSDHDGWCDANDVCPSFAETVQRDSDGDGLGDRCDNCPFHANADQADANGDGRGDVCGPCLASGLPRCGTRVKGASDDIFT